MLSFCAMDAWSKGVGLRYLLQQPQMHPTIPGGPETLPVDDHGRSQRLQLGRGFGPRPPHTFPFVT